mmetsp:Transcript_16370/g.54409  ORF Transcript_16370/g.54409 Transcript_16370/m.54409 type:complete len:377 (-) Transcript_16370:25-1155(-)
MPCGASLVEQHSFARCERGVSFGCLGTSRSIWVQNCRGVFRCAGRRPPFRCGYPEGAPAYNCSCGSGRGDPFWTLSDEETQALARPREAEERRGDSPHRFALLLHGMLGTEVRSSSSDFHSKWHDGGHAGKRMLLRHCAASHLKYVVDAAARGEQVDVFAHSWNREAAPWFDEAYGVVLRGSRHEPPQYTSQALKARSQALSIGRAALLMREFAALRNVTYTLALAIRTDAVLSSPVDLHRMPAETVTFAHWCCKHRKSPPATCAAAGTPRLPLLAHCAVADYAGAHHRAADVERSYFVMDWWLAGPPALVASWGRIASEWDAYAARNAELGIGRKWSHFLWAQHVHEVLRITPSFSSAVCAQIARRHFEVTSGRA